MALAIAIQLWSVGRLLTHRYSQTTTHCYTFKYHLSTSFTCNNNQTRPIEPDSFPAQPKIEGDYSASPAIALLDVFHWQKIKHKPGVLQSRDALRQAQNRPFVILAQLCWSRCKLDDLVAVLAARNCATFAL